MRKLDILNNPIYKLCIGELGSHDKTYKLKHHPS